MRKVNCRTGSLLDYIVARYSGNQRAFAEAQGVKPPQVTQWISKGFIVVDDVLYSPRRELKSATNFTNREKCYGIKKKNKRGFCA